MAMMSRRATFVWFAALFLNEFVKESAWAHLDIAGPVWNDKAGGATGYGVRTLAAYAEAVAA